MRFREGFVVTWTDKATLSGRIKSPCSLWRKQKFCLVSAYRNAIMLWTWSSFLKYLGKESVTVVRSSIAQRKSVHREIGKYVGFCLLHACETWPLTPSIISYVYMKKLLFWVTTQCRLRYIYRIQRNLLPPSSRLKCRTATRTVVCKDTLWNTILFHYTTSAQSVLCLAMGWTTGRLRVDSRQR